MKAKELDALLKLLDDQDKEVYEHVENKILSYGPPVIPVLEEVWSQSLNPILQQRIENVIHKIQFDSLFHTLCKWKDTANLNYYEPNNQEILLKGTLLVARYQYPDLDEQKIRLQLETIKKEIWLELNDDLTALEQVKVINQILFTHHGFSGNTTHYHAPQNSFINNVLESKKGNPLLLSVIYSYIAQSLDIPIYGVNLPEHFILAYEDRSFSITHTDFTAKVLFYVNAFSKGTLFDQKEIDAFLKQLNLSPAKAYYEPCSNQLIIQRMLRNLMNAYIKLGDTEKSNEVQQLLEIFL